MSWLFRRRIRVIPGVRLNLSKSGVTASIGVRGASITLGGKGGTYANVGIPGTGIYSRRKIGGGKNSVLDNSSEERFNPEQYEEQSSQPDEVFVSEDPLDITSDGLMALQEAVLAANQQKNQLKKDLSEIKTSIFTTQLLKLISQITLLYYLLPFIKRKLNTNLSSMKKATEEVKKGINQSAVELELEMQDEARNAYEDLIPSFQELSKSNYVWDITSATDVDQVRTRSAASSTLERERASLRQDELPGITSSYNALCFSNINGADIYLYPGFIVMYNNSENFGILEITNLEASFEVSNFLETESIPNDSEQVGEVWEKTNKDGSRDKRFSDNRQIPVMRYGEITLRSNTGIYEKYMFSNAELAENFVSQLNKFQDLI